jgi:hypothetical protein
MKYQQHNQQNINNTRVGKSWKRYSRRRESKEGRIKSERKRRTKSKR